MIGVYGLLLELEGPEDIQIGKRLRISFKKGFYGYVGSALVGLERRLARHMRTKKRHHWHIDYLVNRTTVRAAIYAETSEKKECLIAHILASRLPSVLGFGCSDCHCNSHLFFSSDLQTLVWHVITAFKELNLKPRAILSLLAEPDPSG